MTIKHQREHWSSRLGFIAAAIGSAIGLGTLWMFPFTLAKNGGGIFVIIYLVCTVLIGIPVFIAELLIGRKAQRGVVSAYGMLGEKHKSWRSVGWLGVLTSLLVLSYYQVVAGWGVNYIFLSLSQFTRDKSPQEIMNVFDAMYQAADVTLLFTFIFAIIVVAMVYQGIQKGIEYWSRIMTAGLLILLLILLAYSATLDGFGEAVHYIFYPDISTLKPSGILAALGLALFTLSVAQGIMVTYGSYMKPEDNIPKTALIVGVSDVVISILAALMIFPVIFTFGFTVEAEAGLVFKTMPVLFSQLPGTLILSTLFFVLLVFTALTSAIAMLEVLVANFMDLYDWSRKKATLLSAAGIFLVGIPSALSGTKLLFAQWTDMYNETFFDTVSGLVGIWLLPVVALLTSIFAGWMMPRKMLKAEFEVGTKMHWFFGGWHFFIRWIVPLAIILVLLEQGGLISIDTWFG